MAEETGGTDGTDKRGQRGERGERGERGQWAPLRVVVLLLSIQQLVALTLARLWK